jgi:hypothetical protein
MSCFLFVQDEEANSKINIDDLYEKRHKRDLKQLSIFKKILNRIHNKIQKTARHKNTDRHIWFVVPEFIYGEPLYDQGDCISYIVCSLEDNHFHIRYIHPNTLFISWSHWVPSYVRNEFKKKTGKILDEYGNIKTPAEEGGGGGATAATQENGVRQMDEQRTAKNYKPPSFIYSDYLMEKLENKLH